MKTALVIYCRAIGFYALLTLPAMAMPVIYITSLVYALIYGWFAWFVFTLLYMAVSNLPVDFVLKLSLLFISVIIAVAFAYHMIGVLDVQEDVWKSLFVIFPFAAVIVGWVSICVSGEKIRSTCIAER